MFVVSSNVLNYEVRNSYVFTLNVNDGVTPAVPVTINVTVNDVRETPIVPVDVWRFSVNENVGGGVVVGAINATDPDLQDVLYFVLREVQQITYIGSFVFEIPDTTTKQLIRRFAVNRQTGVITVRQPGFGASTVLDYEEFVRYNLTIQVRDWSSLERLGWRGCRCCCCCCGGGGGLRWWWWWWRWWWWWWWWWW